jgi:cystathionine gamma-synthase
MGPFDAFLVLRGIRTLALRMEKHASNAMLVAKFLKSHPKVIEVMYPGLESTPNHDIAVRQMHGGFGGTFAFTVKGGFDAAKKVIENCHLALLAVSLGTCDTLIEHPASMTHASVPLEMMKEQGLCPELVRVSVGLENPADIIADLKHALDLA